MGGTLGHNLIRKHHSEDADAEFASMFRESGAERWVECDLTDSAREIHVRLVLVPTAKYEGDALAADETDDRA